MAHLTSSDLALRLTFPGLTTPILVSFPLAFPTYVRVSANLFLVKILLERVGERRLQSLEKERVALVAEGAAIRKLLQIARKEVSQLLQAHTAFGWRGGYGTSSDGEGQRWTRRADCFHFFDRSRVLQWLKADVQEKKQAIMMREGSVEVNERMDELRIRAEELRDEVSLVRV